MPVIVLLADGVGVETLRTALDDGALPSMSRLRAGGGLHEVTSTFPTVTGLAYAPFLLGRFPGSVGLPGLRWFDRGRATLRFPDYTRSYVGYQMNAVNRDLDPAAPTIFDLVPDSAAAMSMITRGLSRRGQLAGLSPRWALRAIATHFGGNVDDWLAVDRDVSDRVVSRVREGDASYLFAAFLGVDKVSHARGQDSVDVQRALRVVDDTVGALGDVLRRQPRPAATHIWIASDHGHSTVRQHDDVHRAIAALGFGVISHPWVFTPRADVAVMVSGNAMAHVYLELGKRARPFWHGLSPRSRELAERVLERPSVDLMLAPLDASSCSVRSKSRGMAVVSMRGGRVSYETTTGDPLGVGLELRGVTSSDAFDATVNSDYPDSVVQIAHLTGCSRAGDLILSATRGWDFRERYEPIPHVSSHGALHRDHMLVPLLLDTPPARRPRRTADLMPSALEVLSVSSGGPFDGDSFM